MIKSKALLFSLVLPLLLVACKKQQQAQQQGGPPAAAVTVAQPTQKEVMEWDEYPGRLDAVEMVEVRARVNGYLQSINFKDGAEVKKGDLLFVIDPRPYQAELDRAKAELVQAETKLELAVNDAARAEKLLKAKAIAEEEADSRNKAKREAEAMIQSAKAMVEVANLNLDYTKVLAPISGRVGRKLITEGNLVNGNQGQSTLLTTIVSLDPIYAYFEPDERAILRYRQLAREGKGESMGSGKVPCELELASETGFPHKGVLDFLDNQIDPGTGTLRIRGVFPNPAPDHVLQPGFFARVRVPSTGKYKAVLIPDLAVGTDQGRKFVYVLNDKEQLDQRPVKLGPMIDGLRLVREGVQANDWIVVNGFMSIRPGMPIKAEKQAPTNSVAVASPQ
jgi:RND family efflux transporter MFP subunit